MLEYSLVQTRGFANVVENGHVTGFKLLIRAPNYRGAWGALIDGVDLSVDGRAFPKDAVRWTLNGQTYSQQELSNSTGVHWGLETPASVFVPLDGGLAAGVHDLHVIVYLRSPYIPAFALPLKFPERCKRTLVPVGEGEVPGFKYGVSLYSYTGDMNTLMTLEDALADIADLGATGLRS